MTAHKEAPASSGASHHEHEDEGRDEPQTPLWLTLLGVALFFAVGLLFLATRPDGKTAEELTRAATPPSASASAAPAPSAAP